jgi:hypothetical protein
MLSLVEVKCPHCGARGQIVMPPLGAIIIGPCPKCEELLIVFCGQVLPLEKDIVMNGTPREKHEHLMGVLTDFLEDRVADLVRQTTPSEEEDADSEALDESEFTAEAEELTEPEREIVNISQPEVDQFKQVDLNLLDNRDYFRAVFG